MQVARQKPSQGWQRAAIIAALVFGVQLVSSLVTFSEVRDWYPTLAKPAWTPPDWLFGPVWTTLYLMIAVAGGRLWQRAGSWSHPAMRFYGLQLTTNFAWSILFFGLHEIGLALFDILLLIAAILATIRAARPLDRTSAWLLVPYLLWVTYATSLNGGILWLNR